jgi:hypothetical protein
VIYQPVTGFIRGQFPMPERPIVLRFGSVLGTAMPETTVNKYRRPLLFENEVWADGE